MALARWQGGVGQVESTNGMISLMYVVSGVVGVMFGVFVVIFLGVLCTSCANLVSCCGVTLCHYVVIQWPIFAVLL